MCQQIERNKRTELLIWCATVGLIFGLGALASTVIAGTALSAAPEGIEIQTEDVTRFYKVYEAASGHPSAEQLQRDYLNPGTAGLHHLAKVRNVTAERIAQTIETNPDLYTDARTCMAALPRVRERLNTTFRKLLTLYPAAQKPPVTIAVGRGRPLAISGPGDGVQIGLEAMCAPNARFLNPNVDDRFVHVIAHEYEMLSTSLGKRLFMGVMHFRSILMGRQEVREYFLMHVEPSPWPRLQTVIEDAKSHDSPDWSL